MKQLVYDFYPKRNILKFFGNIKPQVLNKRHYYTVGARSALFLFLISNPTEKPILVPSYNCGKEIESILVSGHNILTYKIKQDRSIDYDYLRKVIKENPVGYILITHFFGQRDTSLKKIVKLCKQKGIGVIEDCAHCFIGEEQSLIGDAAIFSLRKFYPTNNLGVLVINDNNQYDYKAVRYKFHSGKGICEYGPLAGSYGSSLNLLEIFLFRFSDHARIKSLREKNYSNLSNKYINKASVKNLFAFILGSEIRNDQVLDNIKIVNFWDKFHPAIQWQDFTESVYLKKNTRVLSLNQGIAYGKFLKH